ncbi:MAG: hypothetical protein FWE34_08830 [Defluviitaleaceae bacterium]|nr:hypothetical protein [Defluviitaleaceae bacterium]
MEDSKKIISMLEKMDSRMTSLENKIGALENKVDTGFATMREDFEELKENSEVTRHATNRLLDWSERVESSASSAISIPPLYEA